MDNLIPKIGSAEFWAAIQALWPIAVTLVALVGALLGWVLKYFWGHTKTEKALLRAIVDEYIAWVKTKSDREQIDTASFREWLENEDGVLRCGESYSALKFLTREINKKYASDVVCPEVSEFQNIRASVISKPRWGRIEW